MPRGGRDPRERRALEVDREAVQTGAVGRRAREALGAHHRARAGRGAAPSSRGRPRNGRRCASSRTSSAATRSPTRRSAASAPQKPAPR